ncbi:DUF2884 family protein [Alteromonadaceae bacterium BrNp21-10]|nr:DUF2884 family protein [Alteromonadaceae bacterium BrNp21-10]
MRSLILIASIVSTNLYAHECNINFDGDLKLKNNEVTLKLKNNESVFMNGTGLWVDGQEVVLDQHQAELVNRYYKGYITMAPQVAKLALDAVDMANTGVTLAFTELLGEDDELTQDIAHEFEFLRRKLKDNFYADNGSIQIDSRQFNGDKFLGEEFESEFEQRIESIMERSMGTLLVTLGTQMLVGGFDDFEQRMDEFGQTIEQRMEFQGEEMEQRADKMCYDLTNLDNIESQINKAIPELAKLNIIEAENNRHSM